MGGDTYTHTRTEALRSDGDQAFASDGIVRDEFYEQGISVLWNPTANSKTTRGNGVPQPISKPTPGANCEVYGSSLTGNIKTILGFPTVQVVMNDSSTAQPVPPATGPDHVIAHRKEMWIAPAFGCKPLLDIEAWTHAGADGGSYTMTATSASLGEPDSSLFTVPATAVEMTPTEFYKLLGQNLGADMFRKLDKAYARENAKRTSLHAEMLNLLRRLDLSL